MEDNGHTKIEFREEEDEGQNEIIDQETGEVIEPWYLKRVPKRNRRVL